MINHPHSENRTVPTEFRQPGDALINVALNAVAAFGALDDISIFHPQHIAPFTAEPGFSDIRRAERLGLIERWEQIRMLRKKLPKDGQEAFVTKQHLPGGLNESGGTTLQRGRKLLRPHPFPRIQF